MVLKILSITKDYKRNKFKYNMLWWHKHHAHKEKKCIYLLEKDVMQYV